MWLEQSRGFVVVEGWTGKETPLLQHFALMIIFFTKTGSGQT
eukprot:COSAG06_NODE_295_length_18175_cov_9.088017_25_plen_42_part_00